MASKRPRKSRLRKDRLFILLVVFILAIVALNKVLTVIIDFIVEKNANG